HSRRARLRSLRRKTSLMDTAMPAWSIRPGSRGGSARLSRRAKPTSSESIVETWQVELERTAWRVVAMKGKSLVANVGGCDTAVAKHFYQDILGLEILMDIGWIATYGSRDTMTVQITFLTEGGSGAPIPDVSIEVDDLDAALARMKNAKIPIEYGPADEPWGCAGSSCAIQPASC